MESESHRIGLERYTGAPPRRRNFQYYYPHQTLTNLPEQLAFIHCFSCTLGSVSSKSPSDYVLYSENLSYFIYFNHIFLIHPTPPHSKKSSEKDGDLKIQVEKLWREVNALKEMQALQTGETRLISTR